VDRVALQSALEMYLPVSDFVRHVGCTPNAPVMVVKFQRRPSLSINLAIVGKMRHSTPSLTPLSRARLDLIKLQC
jgi:hypothetical protein